MINNPPPFKGLNTRIPIIIPMKGRGFINQGSTLGFWVLPLTLKWLGLGFRVFKRLGFGVCHAFQDGRGPKRVRVDICLGLGFRVQGFRL